MTFYENIIIEAFRRGDDPVDAVKRAKEALNTIERDDTIE